MKGEEEEEEGENETNIFGWRGSAAAAASILFDFRMSIMVLPLSQGRSMRFAHYSRRG